MITTNSHSIFNLQTLSPNCNLFYDIYYMENHQQIEINNAKYKTKYAKQKKKYTKDYYNKHKEHYKKLHRENYLKNKSKILKRLKKNNEVRSK